MFGLWPRIILTYAEEFFMSLMGSWSRESRLQKFCLKTVTF